MTIESQETTSEKLPDEPGKQCSGVPCSLYWTSDQILKGAKEVQIVHGDDVYRLRLTRNGKLILCK